jgi:hypothetical protein
MAKKKRISLEEAVSSGPQIFDNVLTKEEADKIEEILLGKKISWHRRPSTVGDYNRSTSKKQAEFPFFNHLLIIDDESYSDYGNKIGYSLIKKFLVRTSMGADIIMRAMVNLTTIQNTKYPSPPHVDNNKKHYVVIYYVNDCDGDTVFFKDFNSGKIIKKVSPKKGRFLLFDGSNYHGGMPPKKSNTRVVINYNLI